MYLNIQKKYLFYLVWWVGFGEVVEYLDTFKKSQNIVAGHISGMIATNPETEAQSRN